MYKTYKLKDILTESKIVSEESNPNKRITVRLNVNWVEKRPFKNETKWATKYFIRSKWQFIYWKQNLHKWAFWIIPDNLDWYETTSDIPTFDINTDICIPEMLIYFLKQNDYYKSLEWLAKWVWSKRIHPAQIYDLEIILPDIHKQREIIDKSLINESNINLILSNINKNQSYITNLKQSILQEAIEWKLTKSWREENKDIEPASVLLEKIKTEKDKLIKQKKLKKQKDLKEIDNSEISFDVPKSWTWCRLGDIAEIIAWQSPEWIYYNNKWNWYSFYQWKTEFSNKYLWLPNKWTTNTKKISIKNDILMSVRAPVWPVNINNFEEEISIWRWLAAIRFIELDFINYSWLFLKCKEWEFYKVANSWLVFDSITVWQINNILFPFPPLEEQKEIVKKVDELMELCDELEKQNIDIKENSENLMKAVLSEVFSK